MDLIFIISNYEFPLAALAVVIFAAFFICVCFTNGMMYEKGYKQGQIDFLTKNKAVRISALRQYCKGYRKGKDDACLGIIKFKKQGNKWILIDNWK